jgi:hypothetical protein
MYFWILILFPCIFYAVLRLMTSDSIGGSTRWWPALLAIALGASILAGSLSSMTATAIASDNVGSRGEITIVASSDDSEIEGQWGLFGGSIGEKRYYYFYRTTSDGGFRQGKVSVEKSVIYQDVEPGGRAYIVVNGTLDEEWGSRGWNQQWSPVWHLNGPGWWVEWVDPNVSYEIHVPPGAIREQHEFDLN